jgi:chromosome segregation ATPase
MFNWLFGESKDEKYWRKEAERYQQMYYDKVDVYKANEKLELKVDKLKECLRVEKIQVKVLEERNTLVETQLEEVRTDRDNKETILKTLNETVGDLQNQLSEAKRYDKLIRVIKSLWKELYALSGEDNTLDIPLNYAMAELRIQVTFSPRETLCRRSREIASLIEKELKDVEPL